MARTRFSDARPAVDSRLRVRYKDTDQMGIAHHSNHVVWFEIGRTDLCRVAGLEYRRIEELGWVLVVTEIGCRYRGPFRYDDEVLIRTQVEEGNPRLIRFCYQLIEAGSGEVRAEGFSSHVWVDKATRRPRAATPEVFAKFAQFLG
ncbi:MAG: acyl-CoA thioesterase [Thermoanaerobaculia bacterium]|nr:acyl-CoA thioesterase [Thermoanaerobaculia bacterium]